jgi:hypothetical protein
MEAHGLSGKHEFRTGQADDEGFPIDRRQPEVRRMFDAIFRQIVSETAKLARMLDIPINVTSTATFY